MAENAETGADGGAPTAGEIAEIMADLEFFLEMEEATSLESEDEAVEESPGRPDGAGGKKEVE